VTITADNKTIVAGENAPSFTYEVSGFIGGNTFTNSPIVKSPSADFTHAGTYPIIAIGADAGINYDINYVNGMLTVNEPTVHTTVTANDGSETTHYKDITVVKNVTKIRTPLSTVNITKGKMLTLPIALDDGAKTITGAKLTYTSSNKKIVTVDSNGKIKGVKSGKAKITVKSANGKSLIIKIVVSKKATKLKKFRITGTPKKIAVGKIKQLKIKLAQPKASDLKITYKSSKPSVLSVDKAGKIIAIKKGTAIITVKVGNKTVKTKKIQIIAA
jgi:uncharacterized protein YjdB